MFRLSVHHLIINGLSEVILVCSFTGILSDAEQLVVYDIISVRKNPAENTEFTYVIKCIGFLPNKTDLNEILRWINTKVALNDEISF